MVYIGLQDIENNGIFDWLASKITMSLEREHAIVFTHLRCKKTSDKLFLVTKRGLKRLYKGGFEHC